MRFPSPFALLLPVLMAGCATAPPPAPEPVVVEPAPTASELFADGRDAYDRGDYHNAAALFDEAAAVDPNYADAVCWLGHAYNRLGAREQAKAAYRRCLGMRPNDARGNFEIAKLYMDEHEYTPAETYFQKAIDADPANAEAYFYLAEILRIKGQCTPPKSLYKKALSLKPDFHDAKVGLKDVARRNCVAAKPVPEKRAEFTGGGKALSEGEW